MRQFFVKCDTFMLNEDMFLLSGIKNSSMWAYQVKDVLDTIYNYIHVAKKRCMQVNVKLLCTVKHVYSEHPYNELMILVKWFSFPAGFKHIVRLSYITNSIVMKQITRPSHFLISVFYCTLTNLRYKRIYFKSKHAISTFWEVITDLDINCSSL